MTAILEQQKNLDELHQQRMIRTVAKRKREWLTNVRANTNLIRHDASELWLDNGYPEMISIAAGPSLQEDLPKLRQMIRRGRRFSTHFEVVAVDAAFKWCLDNGIEPDFVVATDASEKILDMFAGTPKTKAKLVLNVVASPKLALMWPGDIYWFVMANQFYDLDNKAMIQDLHAVESRVGCKIVPGGNVSSIALGFCLSVRNANQLFLYGHDFCWTARMYCGTYMEHLAAQRVADEGASRTIFQTTNTRGHAVTTTLSLKKFSDWHAEVCAHARRRVVNCTSSTILTY